MKSKYYIFRWKTDGICVIPSRSKTREQCWEYALEALRPAFDPIEDGRDFVRKHGEVIEDGE